MIPSNPWIFHGNSVDFAWIIDRIATECHPDKTPTDFRRNPEVQIPSPGNVWHKSAHITLHRTPLIFEKCRQYPASIESCCLFSEPITHILLLILTFITFSGTAPNARFRGQIFKNLWGGTPTPLKYSVRHHNSYSDANWAGDAPSDLVGPPAAIFWISLCPCCQD